MTKQVKIFRGPLATVYACPCCDYRETVKRTRKGDRVGSGRGFAVGGGIHSKVAAHIRKAHSDCTGAQP
jgi:hypothetical protein